MEIYKAKYDIPCDKCKKKITVGRLFFKQDNVLYCVKCVQIFIEEELEKNQCHRLDLKNMQGKAYMMEMEYKKDTGAQPKIKVL